MAEGAEELAIETHFVVSERFSGFLFELPQADLTPVSGGHFSDEEFVERGDGFESFSEAFDDLVKAVPGFTFDQDGAGEEPVGGAVAGGTGFALRGFGAPGACSVGPGCGFLFVCCHGVGILVGYSAGRSDGYWRGDGISGLFC